MPDLGLLVGGEDHLLLLLGSQALLHQRQVERVLLEDLGQRPQLGRQRPVIVEAEVTHLRRSRPIGRIRRGQREQHHLEDALLGVVAVRPEPVHDRVEAAPRRPVREHREEDRVDQLRVADGLDVNGVAHLPLHLCPLAVRQPSPHVGHLRRRMGRHQRHLF